MNSTPPTAGIHIWVPGIREGTGGIQAFCRTLVQAVRESFPERPLHVLVKNDVPLPDDNLHGSGIQFTSVAATAPWLRTVMMAARGIAIGIKERPALVLAAHLHFLPAVQILRAMTGARCCGFLYGIEAWNVSLRHRIHGMQAADRLIAISQFTRDRVVSKYGVREELIEVVPCTFDVTRFSIGSKPADLLKKYGLRAEQPVLLTLSRLAVSERYKGHRQVLVALRSIIVSHPDVRYIIAGEGDDLPRLKEAVTAMGLDSHVIFAGHVPVADLPELYQLCDLFLMPSSNEGFGIVFLEAMASGKPVLAGDIDGSVDALDHGRLGALTDPNNPREISRVACAILDRTYDHPLMFDPVALREAVASQFGYPRVRALLVEAIAPLLDGTFQTSKKNLSSRPPATPVPSRPTKKAPSLAVLTQLTSPYQVEFFNVIAAAGKCNLDVIYLTTRDRTRQWTRPSVAHNHLVLDDPQVDATDAMNALLAADLSIFNYYMDAFSLRAIRRRAASGMPWAFWGERPGFRRLGVLGRWFRQLVLRPLHHSQAPIWGIGEFGVDGYRQEFGDNHAYRNVPYFSELNRFRRPGGGGHAGRERVFLLSSALSRRKGADLVAQAFAKVAANRSDLRLIVMGGGSLKRTMEKALSSVAGQVTWAGFQPWNALPAFFHQADILLAPSRHDGWGLAVVEGLAAGLPVIGTTRAGASLEFIEDGKNGWLCPINDLDCVARAMQAAADLTPAQLEAMSRAASDSVEKHTLQHGAELFLQAALDALQTPKQPGSKASRRES